ncbi:hypothetical protein [Amycolatopsis silviterrae]|uniref:Lipoprotein n=1 Tax=Amycolatopsis silviterrae TaxID=1656914 RepID=A0ABW5H5B2_9PSEU
MRRRLFGLAGVVLVGAVACGGPTLDREAAMESALPVEKDVPGFVASGGIDGPLRGPQGMQMGRIALAGDKLAAQCRTYGAEGTGWACDGLVGLGTVGFEDVNNVEARIASFVLAYDGEGSAETAWSKLVDATRANLHELSPRQGSDPAEGDQSQSFTSEVGTTVVARVGSVVVLAMSHYADGYATNLDTAEPVSPAHPADPIRTWADVQARKAAAALAG